MGALSLPARPLSASGADSWALGKDGNGMAATTTSTTPREGTQHGLASAFTSVLNAAVERAAFKLEHKVDTLAQKLNGVGAGSESSGGLAALADEGLDELGKVGGLTEKAGAEGIKAGLHGNNPVWAAVKGAWQTGTPAARAAVIAAIASAILLLLFSPVLLVVFLLSLLIVFAVHRLRARASKA